MCMDVKFELIKKKNAHNLLINSLKGFFGSIWNFGVYHNIVTVIFFILIFFFKDFDIFPGG